MKVIPVIDVLGGKVVHAVRGRRKEYQPLRSRLCSSTSPLDVAAAFRKLGFSTLYVADLDAILGGKANLPVLRDIADKNGLELMVDAGVDSLKRPSACWKTMFQRLLLEQKPCPPSASFPKSSANSEMRK